MDLSDVTVVVLSRGREEILSRTLDYWAEVNISVLVLHNTNAPLNESLLSSNIEYHVDQVAYGERCGHVPGHLQTEFAILCADDEVFIPSAIFAMKMTLRNNPFLSSVGGSTIAIGKYGPLLTGTHSYSNMQSYVNNGSDCTERLQSHFNDVSGYRNGGIYRLMRKDLMIDLMETFHEVASISTPYIYEVTGEIIVNAYGPSVYLDNIYWIRNWINAPVGHKNWDRKLYFANWMSELKYHEEVQKWNQILMSRLQLPANNYKECIDNVVRLRRSSEEREITSLSRRFIPISENIKWFIRKMLIPKTLPNSVDTSLDRMQNSEAIFTRSEIFHAISFLV